MANTSRSKEVYVVNAAEFAGGGGGAGAASADREIVITTYRAKSASTGVASGDTVTASRVIDVSDAPVQVGATVWYNESTGAALAGAPGAATLEIAGTPGLTDAQLRASGLPLPVGAATAAAQAAQTAATQAWTPQVATTVTLAVTTTSSAAQAVTAGESVRFSNAGTTPVAIMFGTSAVVATEATSLDIMPGSAETITIAAGVTHFAAIMQSGTGRLKFTRGAGA